MLEGTRKRLFNMKKEIHPKYHKKADVKCVCGKTVEVGSTKEKIRVEICSACHPFYTGKKQLVDAAGRAERFENRRKIAEENKKMASKKKTEKAEKKSPTKN